MSEIQDDEDLSAADLEIINHVVDDKFIDAQTPGFQAEFSPLEAEIAGAFEETALTEKDAMDSVIDQLLTEVGSLK